MELIKQIQQDKLQARKNKQPELLSTLTTLEGEAMAVGKNKGNRMPTDEEVVAIVKKTIDNIKITLGHLKDDAQKLRFQDEQVALEKYLPKQLSVEELTDIIKLIMLDHNKLGAIMGKLKADFNGQYDGKVAKEIAEELLK